MTTYQHMFSLSYPMSYMYMKIFEIKKDITVLFHKYPDKIAKYYTRPIFSNGFNHANLDFFAWFQIFIKNLI